jgi:PilZ domain
MPDKPTRRIGPLAETLSEVDLREVPRTICPVPVPLKVVVRPSFVPMTLAVKDISVKGVSLIARGPTAALPPGTSLAIFWKYGAPERWRTIRLDVIWTSARADGGWSAGCMFAERLDESDVEGFLQQRVQELGAGKEPRTQEKGRAATCCVGGSLPAQTTDYFNPSA